MKQFGGVWLPDHENHLIEWMKKKNQVVDGKLTYQLDKQNAALSHVTRWRRAVDIGGHCGLWSMQLVKRFARVDAFEPIPEHRECFVANLANAGPGTAVLHAMALGETDGNVRLETAPTSSGDTRIVGDGNVPLRRLDDILADADDVDFIKLDCEGYELFALRGGEQLIRRCMPVIIVEQKPGRGQRFGLSERGAVEYLQGIGYKLAKEISGDFIMVPE